MDLAQMWRSRRWRKLLSIIDQLPRDSRYVEAQLDDEDLAVHMLDLPQAEASRRMSEWTTEAEILASVADRLVDVVNVLLHVNGGTATDIRPQARPSTALDRIRQRQRRIAHESLVARVLNREGGEP